MSQLTHWRSLGIDIYLSGENTIGYSGPSHAITAEVLEELRIQKPELIAELQSIDRELIERRAFAKWMERMWVKCSRPQWWDIHDTAIRDKDWERVAFSWDMLTRVLEDGDVTEPGGNDA